MVLAFRASLRVHHGGTCPIYAPVVPDDHPTEPAGTTAPDAPSGVVPDADLG